MKFFSSANSTITSSGDKCIDKCRRRGQQYYWCHKETTLWGFCTPDFLIQRTGKKFRERKISLTKNFLKIKHWTFRINSHMES